MWGIAIEDGIVGEYLRGNEEIRAKILRDYEISESEIGEIVKKLRKWARKNTKLPKESQDKQFLELMLIRNKFRVDQTKRKIEGYFKTLSSCSEFFCDLDQIKLVQEVGVVSASRELSPSGERIGILKIKSPETCTLDDIDLSRFIRIAVAVGLVAFHFEYNFGNRYILDFQGVSFRMFLKATPFLLLKLVKILQNVLSVRINGIELINVPSYVNYVMKLAKMVTPAKLYSKIRVHDDLESLYRVVPKRILPREYGGEFPAILDGLEHFDSILEAHREFFGKIAEISRK